MARRVSRPAAVVAGLLVALFAHRAGAAPVPKGDDKSWVGRTVLPKQPAPTAVALAPPGQQSGESSRTLLAASWEVKAEKDARVQVIEDGTAYWVEKDKLVPLADAVEFYTKAIKENERDAYAHNFRGWANHLLGKSDDAIKDFGAFLKLIPTGADGDRVVGLSNRGLVLAETGRFDAALNDLDEAVKLGHVPARHNRGWVCELKGDYKRAVKDYEAILDQRPTDALALNNMAWLRATCPVAEFRDGPEAVRLAKRVCQLSGNREGMFLDTLAAALAETGDFAGAVKAQELALGDAAYVRKNGLDAQKRLQLYKDKKPYHGAPPKP